MIYDKFRRFGNIVKLLIFDKGEVTKFFIEYSEIEQAVKVIIALIRQRNNLRELSFYQPSARWTYIFQTLRTSISKIRPLKGLTIHRKSSIIKISCKNTISWPNPPHNPMHRDSTISSCNPLKFSVPSQGQRPTILSILQERSLWWKYPKRIEMENKTSLIFRSRAT